MLKIVLHAPFSQLAGGREVDLPCGQTGMTVQQALTDLAARFPGLQEQVVPGKMNQTFVVMAGGRIARADSPLADGEEVLLLPPIAGG